jgi:uncharacterized membrane protein
MSEERKSTLPEKSRSQSATQKQAERDDKRALVTHPDGRHEEVEIRSERMWSGVLPRPEDFAKFGAIVPSAPERLLRMAEMEQQHRIDLETKIVPENIKAGRRGQWLGAAISVIALVLASVTSYFEAPWQLSVALVGVPVLSVARSLVTAFRVDHDD